MFLNCFVRHTSTVCNNIHSFKVKHTKTEENVHGLRCADTLTAIAGLPVNFPCLTPRIKERPHMTWHYILKYFL